MLRHDYKPNLKKLTCLKEDIIIQYILNLDVRGFSPILAKVVDIANKLLKAQGQGLVSINQPNCFINYLAKLKISFNQVRDYQRIKQEDPIVIRDQFQLVENIKVKYSIQDNNMYNFNKTSFQIGIRVAYKVVTSSKRQY